MSSPQICHLFTSPGHNFLGRHGKKSENHEIIEHEAIELVAEKGIYGDRFFDWKKDYKGQITFIDLAVIHRVREYAQNMDLSASAFRRNVVTSGINLNTLIGKKFSIAGIEFQGVEECKPCYWMDEACGKSGIEDLMKGHGGLRCRILNDGILKKGEIHIHLAEA